MGYVPPPPPISREEFARRRAAGARTLEELDPAFHRWLIRGRHIRAIGWIVVVLGAIGLMAVLLAVLAGKS